MSKLSQIELTQYKIRAFYAILRELKMAVNDSPYRDEFYRVYDLTNIDKKTIVCHFNSVFSFLLTLKMATKTPTIVITYPHPLGVYLLKTVNHIIKGYMAIYLENFFKTKSKSKDFLDDFCKRAYNKTAIDFLTQNGAMSYEVLVKTIHGSIDPEDVLYWMFTNGASIGNEEEKKTILEIEQHLHLFMPYTEV